MTKRVAPQVVNGKYTLSSANFIKMEWDSVGEGFLYELRRGRSMRSLYLESDDSILWDETPIYIKEFNKFYYFDESVQPLNSYYYTIRTVGRGFEPSPWYDFGEVSTFQYNNNSISTQSKFTLSNQVITKNLNDVNNIDQIAFGKRNGDAIPQTAYLMQRGFVFDPYDLNSMSQVQDKIVTNSKLVKNYGNVQHVCTEDIDRTVPSLISNNLYSFERWQSTAKVSNDYGVTWYDYTAFPGRLGNPVANNLITQGDAKTYALGFDMIYEAKSDEIIDFSNVEIEWSSIDETFDFVDVVTVGLPFKAAEFSNVAPLPDLLTNKTESFAVGDYKSDEIIVATANGNIQYFDGVNATIIDDENSDMTGLLKFEDEVIRLIEDSNVWDGGDTAYAGNPCVRNVIFYNDPNNTSEEFEHPANGKFFFLYLGDWVTDTSYTSPRFTQDVGITQYDADGNLNPYIGVYVLNYHLEYQTYNSEDADAWSEPIFRRDDSAATKLTRIFGNTEYERERLDLFSAMSRDENDLIIKIRNDDLKTEVEEPWRSIIVNPYSGTDDIDPLLVAGTDTVNDQLLIDGNSEVTSAIKYFTRPYYTTSNKTNQQIIAFDSSLNVKNKPMDYYDVANAVWMEHDGHRDYKSNNNQHFVLYKEDYKTTPIKTNDYRIDETYTVNAENIVFNNFDSYADGVLIADVFDNIIGYYKFDTSLINFAEVIWYPELTLFTATLLNTDDKASPPALHETALEDPNLVSVFDSLGASEYFGDGLFADFTKYYIEFLTKGSGTSYNNMYNLMNFHDDLHPLSSEHLYNSFYLRNTLPNTKEKDDLVRLFLNRQTDFYSAKGVEDSYKLLFKLLYNEDVSIETERTSEFKFVIRVITEYMDPSAIGKKARTPTGYGIINSFEQYYEGNISKYVIELNTPSGKFIQGQTLTIDAYNINNVYPMITVNGSLETSYINNRDIDASSKNKSYYTMKVTSKLQYNQYESDVKRFVHPVGFPFIGITLITMLVNSGVSIDSTDTEIEQSLITTFDSGVPTKLVEYVSDLSIHDDERQYQGYYESELIVKINPLYNSLPAGYTVDDESEFILNLAGFNSDDEYNTDTGNTLLYGLTPAERRKPYAPLFDTSAFSYSNVYRGPLDDLGKVKYPNPILYKRFSERVEIEDDSNIKEINVPKI